jgi:hypothetical protein
MIRLLETFKNDYRGLQPSDDIQLNDAVGQSY